MSDSPRQTSSSDDSSPLEVAIAVVEDDGHFLIGQRPDGVPLAGYWEFPGGKVGANESPAEAAARECWEETGQPVEVCGVLASVEHRYDHGHLRLRFFRCRVDRRVRLSAPYRWVPRRQLGEYEFPPANRHLLEALVNDNA